MGRGARRSPVTRIRETGRTIPDGIGQPRSGSDRVSRLTQIPTSRNTGTVPR
jgi:hypothetical protein